MRCAFVTFDDPGYTLHPKTRASLEAATKRWGWDLVAAPRVDNDPRAVWWYQKFKWLGWHADAYDLVLLMDGDIMVRADAPPPPDPGDTLGLVDPSQPQKQKGHREKRHAEAREWARILGMPTDPVYPMGHGAFRLVPRSFYPFYQTCWNTIRRLNFRGKNNWDMGVEAVLRAKHNIPVTWISNDWDHDIPSFQQEGQWLSTSVRDSYLAARPLLPGYINHFGGERLHRKFARMNGYDWTVTP